MIYYVQAAERAANCDKFRVFRKDVHAMNKKLEEILSTTKLNELLKKEEKRECGKKVVLSILAVVGIVAAVAGIAYAVYRFFFAEDTLEDFEDEYDDDFDFLDEEDDEDEPSDEAPAEEEAPAKEETPVAEEPAEKAAEETPAEE